MSKNIMTVSTSVAAAAVEAAVADGLIPANGVYKNDENMKFKKASLRRGKWTTEEEYYANRLIYEFKLGLLPLTDGTTLRTFLSKLLNCDPMRISKKFVGQNCIGKQVFRRRQQDLEKLTIDQIEQSRKELAELERKFLERVAQTNRSKSSGNGSKSLKDGKIDYEDEHGNTILAPWMIPPDEVAAQQYMLKSTLKNSGIDLSALSQNPAALIDPRPQQQSQSQTNAQFPHHPYGYIQYNTTGPAYMNDPRFISAPNRPTGEQQRNDGKLNGLSLNKGGGYHQNDNMQQQQQQMAYQQYMQQMQQYHPYNIFNQNHSTGSERNLMHNSDLSVPRVSSFDVLSSIAHLNESQSMESLSSSAYKNLNWGSVGAGLGNMEGLNHSNSQDEFNLLGNTASSYMLGELAVWPSFSNLNFMASQSMEDLRGNAANTLEDEGKVDTDSVMKVGSDRQSGNNNIINNTANHQSNTSNSVKNEKNDINTTIIISDQQRHSEHTSLLGATSVTDEQDVGLSIDDNNAIDNHFKSESTAVSSSSSAAAGISKPSSSLANSTKIKTPIVDFNATESVPHTSNKSSESSGIQNSVLAKNPSVDDFWMLVNMGDLPQPEQGVLSSKLWPSQQQPEQTSTSAIASSSLEYQNQYPSDRISDHILAPTEDSSLVGHLSYSNHALSVDETIRHALDHSISANGVDVDNNKEVPTILIKRDIDYQDDGFESRDGGDTTFNKRSKS